MSASHVKTLYKPDSLQNKVQTEAITVLKGSQRGGANALLAAAIFEPLRCKRSDPPAGCAGFGSTSH